MSDKELAKIIMKNLNEYMESADMSQSELARRLGVAQSSVSHWCSGERVPRMKKIDAICNELHITRSMLIEEHRTDVLSPVKQRLMEYVSALSDSDCQILIDMAERLSR